MAKLYSSHIEQKLLVCALQTRSPKIRATILTETDESDFGSPYGKQVRKRIDTLRELGKSLGSALDLAEDVAISGSDELKAFVKTTSKRRKLAESLSLDDVNELIRKLKVYKNYRIVHEAQVKIAELTDGEVEEKDLEEVSSLMQQTIVNISRGFDKQPITHFGQRQSGEEAQKVFESVLQCEENRFVSTGLDGLDIHMRGFERGNIVTVSATSGGGKTTIAMVMAINQYLKANLNVCIVSMEMTRDELLRRAMAKLSGVPHSKIRYAKSLDREERAEVMKAARAFQKHGKANRCTYSVWPPSDPTFTPYKIEAALTHLKYDIIYIDYITLFHQGRNRDPWQAQFEYSRYLKLLAKKMNCVFVILTQLSEEEQIKYGRAVKENTDYWIWWRYRDGEEKETGNVDLLLGKARHAPTCKVPSKFKLSIMDIETFPPTAIGVSEKKDKKEEKGKGKKKKVERGDMGPDAQPYAEGGEE